MKIRNFAFCVGLLAIGVGLAAAAQALARADAGVPAGTAAVAPPEGHAMKKLVKETVVKGSLADVWRCWTTSEGASEFLTPWSKIELKPGGAYEIYFSDTAPEGQRGSEGCHTLSYLPMEMLSFEWRFPPGLPELRAAAAHTWVVIQLTDLGEGQGVKVRLSQLGWQDGADWDKGYAYFDKAWEYVLGNLQKRFATGPIDWKSQK